MLDSAASRVMRAGKEEVRHHFGYVLANLWTLVPVAAAFLIATVAANIVSVPTGCSDKTSTEINWLLCRVGDPRANPVYVLTQRNWNIVNGDATLVAPAPAARTGHVSTSQHAVSAHHHLDIKRAVALASREGTARLTWAVSYGVLVAACIIASIASLLFIVQAITGHRRTFGLSNGAISAATPIAPAAPAAGAAAEIAPAPLPATIPAAPVPGAASPHRSAIRASATYNSFVFLVIAVALALFSAFVDYLLLRQLFGEHTVGAFRILGSLNSEIPPFQDEVTLSLATQIREIDGFISKGSKLLVVAVVLMAVQVASTLYQSPGDEDFRLANLPQDPRNAFYLRYLGRSFDRLKIAIYLGAGLLVVTLAEIGAQFAWALSMLPPDSGNNPSGVNDALAAFGQTMTSEIGFAFTLFLAALYFPAIFIIQERAREFYRTRNPDRSLQDQNDFLEANGLSFRISQSYSDFLALLAPVAASSAGALFKVLT